MPSVASHPVHCALIGFMYRNPRGVRALERATHGNTRAGVPLQCARTSQLQPGAPCSAPHGRTQWQAESATANPPSLASAPRPTPTPSRTKAANQPALQFQRRPVQLASTNCGQHTAAYTRANAAAQVPSPSRTCEAHCKLRKAAPHHAAAPTALHAASRQTLRHTQASSDAHAGPLRRRCPARACRHTDRCSCDRPPARALAAQGRSGGRASTRQRAWLPRS